MDSGRCAASKLPPTWRTAHRGSGGVGYAGAYDGLPTETLRDADAGVSGGESMGVESGLVSLTRRIDVGVVGRGWGSCSRQKGCMWAMSSDSVTRSW
jgi:hypothetical protein